MARVEGAQEPTSQASGISIVAPAFLQVVGMLNNLHYVLMLWGHRSNITVGNTTKKFKKKPVAIWRSGHCPGQDVFFLIFFLCTFQERAAL